MRIVSKTSAESAIHHRNESRFQRLFNPTLNSWGGAPRLVLRWHLRRETFSKAFGITRTSHSDKKADPEFFLRSRCKDCTKIIVALVEVSPFRAFSFHAPAVPGHALQ